jgi:hypothetical protein
MVMVAIVVLDVVVLAFLFDVIHDVFKELE